MFLDANNEIDKKISEVFSPEIINSILPENIDYFGINVSVKTGEYSLKHIINTIIVCLYIRIKKMIV